ncbi:hypothetical protein IV498_16125 [Paenarthrobacter sp. Z7-10]|uniref:endonuclease domain-containing protein n=1 Tax=Paenarthrobacter sp. Z7-10 TaxID=2787635 RepID=UPI0022A9CB4C|nr:hypothetical protein [Paenarthrobacter sp. Z7-10]MCZ2404663.1 hypothetical protein [Paenarthrobacter sp. Z7-10]
MRPSVPLPEPWGASPFTVADALSAGVSYSRLRNRGLACPSRGVRSPAGAAGDDGSGVGTGDTAAGAAQLAKPLSRVTGRSAASHATAWKIWAYPGYLPGGDDPRTHLSRAAGLAIPRRRDVVGHKTQLFDDEVCCVDGLWITSRVRTWLDISRRMSVDELTVVADHLLRIPRPGFEGRSKPYATMADLAAILDRHKGTPGIQKARLALEQARVGSDSAPETRLRLAIGRAGLPDPLLNEVVDLGIGVTRQPDFSFPEYRVAAEYEGDTHSLPAQVVRDISREEDFIRAGWLQLRISKRHMSEDAKPAVAKIRNALLSCGWSPSRTNRVTADALIWRFECVCCYLLGRGGNNCGPPPVDLYIRCKRI